MSHTIKRKRGDNMITQRETNFTTDKYNNPVYLSKRDSVAQVIGNALFMKRGNNVSHPDRFVDIEQWLNKPEDRVDEPTILSDLQNTVGSDVGSYIRALTLNNVKTEKGEEIALLLIRLLIDNTEDLLAITLQREKDNIVRYSYNFINEDVPI